MLIGQAPGAHEGPLGRPFAWTAGKTHVRLVRASSGSTRREFRARVYMAAVCRCFPGKAPGGGDRVPAADEIARCSRRLVGRGRRSSGPQLVIPVGKLAIAQVLPDAQTSSTDVVGGQHRAPLHGHERRRHPAAASVGRVDLAPDRAGQDPARARARR